MRGFASNVVNTIAREFELCLHHPEGPSAAPPSPESPPAFTRHRATLAAPVAGALNVAAVALARAMAVGSRGAGRPPGLGAVRARRPAQGARRIGACPAQPAAAAGLETGGGGGTCCGCKMKRVGRREGRRLMAQERRLCEGERGRAAEGAAPLGAHVSALEPETEGFALSESRYPSRIPGGTEGGPRVAPFLYLQVKQSRAPPPPPGPRRRRRGPSRAVGPRARGRPRPTRRPRGTSRAADGAARRRCPGPQAAARADALTRAPPGGGEGRATDRG